MSDEFTVSEITAADTRPLRRAVLRNGRPDAVVAFPDDDVAGAFHLGARLGPGGPIMAVSTWVPRPLPDEPEHPAIQLRGMATATSLQGTGLGALLLDAGCERAAEGGAELVWARARDAALNFYQHNGFIVVGDGFIDKTTKLPHHLVVRYLHLAPDQAVESGPRP